MSADSVAKWNCVSGVALSWGSTRQNIAPWLMPIASGPCRHNSHSSPMRALPNSERNWSLVVIGRATW